MKSEIKKIVIKQTTNSKGQVTKLDTYGFTDVEVLKWLKIYVEIYSEKIL